MEEEKKEDTYNLEEKDVEKGEEEEKGEEAEQDSDNLEYSDNTEEEQDSDDSDNTEILEDDHENEDDVQTENKEGDKDEEEEETDENMFTTPNNTQSGGNKEEIIKMPYNFFYNKMKYLSDAYKKYRSPNTPEETDSPSVNETPNVITITIPKVGNVERVTIDTIGYNPSQWRIVQYLLKHDVKWLDMEVWEMDDTWIAIGAITNKSGRSIPIDPKLSNTLLIKQIIESEEE